ncbi:hypothetical protein [Crateriforma conspicua]|uniref:Uncharacterized protein n=1 Tax=Crateriforma conspicua TaxID=2527996 RepID=A0A5C5XRU0_9PLAN|nr:hypothetical protein [Crateriforma conspicua]QDV66257.1 hypothetical protein Mal65_54330 [Crateriforma conspicua]TWT65614.1 hypothetical protein Pan14r_51610 [Crateriforma conspicua]
MSDQLLRHGLDCYTYYSTGADYENPVWALTDIIRDESLGLSKSRAEFMSRGSKFKRQKGALIEATGSFTVEYRKGDTFIDKLMDSFLNNTPIDMAFAFDPIAEEGTEYIRFPIEVFEFPFDRPLEDGATIEVEIGLTEFNKSDGSLVDLEWLTVPATP